MKPLDFGYGGCTGSINADGRLVAINTYHEEHGYVTLTAQPPFPDEDRYDAKKVRAYRKSLATSEGFGMRFKLPVRRREAFLVEGGVPLLRFTLENDVVAECLTYVNVTHPNGVAYLWRFSEPGNWATLDGDIWLQRSAYTQLTEGGVMAFPSAETEIEVFAEGLRIHNGVLPAWAAFSIGTPFNGLALIPGEETTDNIYIGLGKSKSYAETYLHYVQRIDPTVTLDFWQSGYQNHDTAGESNSGNAALQRAWVYAVQCSVFNAYTTSGYVRMLTDHMLLPLSWNRDAYYVAATLMHGDGFDLELLKGHVRWMFEQAQRPQGYWGRSYTASGRVKDSGYQLDQQIYPLLELAAYVQRTDDTGLLQSLMPHALSALEVLLASRGDQIELLPTDETPADDPLDDYPFHFSSQILLWYTLRKLDDVIDRSIRPRMASLIDLAEMLKATVKEKFVVVHESKEFYAYAISRDNGYRLYHDANDIPLVMMPIWGFCDKDDPVWRNTIEFAFSDENPGFYDGVLGSVHTPAPWALGDAQELILCKVIGDRERYARVWERVEKAAQWDGALPEAYDANTFEVVSRHWFAWPNAMIAIADSISWDWEQEAQA